MTELDDLPWPPPAVDDMALERKPRRCLHPKWERRLRAVESGVQAIGDGSQETYCGRCGKVLDPAKARLGKNSRNRGNAFEREVAAKLGGRRVGQYGDQVDVDVPGYLRVQTKNGLAYPERIDRWLRAIPIEAGLLRAVVLGDAPGSAGKRRSLIVMDLDEYAMWHGRGK